MDKFQIPPQLQNAIMQLCSILTFTVSFNDQTSNKYEQARGIRQGCTLCLYLFLIAMTALMKTIRQDRNLQAEAIGRIRGIDFGDILFADDTLLIADTKSRATTHLQLTERTAALYGLNLNRTKCHLLGLNIDDHITFTDGTILHQGQEVTYLGVTFNSKLNTNQ